MNNCGKLIVIDGLDGSGKTTQIELLSQKLIEKKFIHKTISFPDYNSPSSALVKMYLAGEIASNADEINAYSASSFYAVDRYANFKMNWEKDFLDEKVIISARYTTSNAIHQMSKLPKNEWDTYLDWLFDYEYGKLELPKPDLVIFLDMPIEISQELLSMRYQGDELQKDIHEKNVEYLKICRETALYCAKKLGWTVISCSKDGKALPINEINENIYSQIMNILQ